MPRFKLPEDQILKNLGSLLRQIYTTKSNRKRNSVIDIIQGLTSQLNFTEEKNWKKIVVGAVVFALESIEEEYKINPVKFSEGYLYNAGSKLYMALENSMNLSENNEINDDERLVYLNAFYQYIQQNKEAKFNASQYWKSSQALLDQTVGYLKKIKNREYDRIELFTNSRPKLHVLRSNLNELWLEYDRKTKGRWISNKHRQNLIVFLELISQTCEENYPIKKENSIELNDLNYVKSFNTQMGVYIFVLKKIHDEYSWLKPENSLLYRQILQAINAKSLDAINLEKQTEWMRSLANHFAVISSVETYYNRIKHDASLQGVNQLDKFQSLIDEQVLKLEKEKLGFSRMRRYVTRGTSHVTQFGLSMVATRYAAQAFLPLVPYAGGVLGTAIAGPVGLVFYGTAGTLIATQLGRLVEEKLMPKALAGVYGKALQMAGEIVADTTVGVAARAFSASTGGLKDFMAHYRKQTNDDFLEEWIKTLVSLPDQVMCSEDKKHIQMLLSEPQEYENYLSASIKA